MARRRRVDPSSPSDVGTQTEPLAEGAPPRIDVRMSGTADQVKRQLGVQTEPEAKPENGQDDEKKKFVEALRNPKYVIRVKRMTPREFNGQKTNVEVWTAELPMGYQEIQEEVGKAFGGEKYRVAIVDQQSNTTIAADVFTVDGDPIIPENDATQEEIDRLVMHGTPKSASELTEDALERRARLTAKQIELEAYEEQLHDARKRRESGSKQPAQDNTRVEELERKVAEAKHQAELEARDRKHAEELRELKAMIAQNAKPAKPEGASETAQILAQMQKSQEAADRRFEALQKQMQDDKMNALIEEVKKSRSGQGGSLLDQAEAILKLKKVFGWGGGDDDEDDEVDDKDDDRPWYERALDKLGGKFGDKLLEKFTAMEEKGETVGREQFMKEMEAYAAQVAADAAAKQQARQLPPPAAPVAALPAPPPPPRANPPAAVQAPMTSLPPPPPAPAVQPAVAAPVPGAMTIEQETVVRVAGVLEMVEREMSLRPNQYLWNYEGAYNALPEEVLEKVCAAPDPVTMIDAFAIPNISPEKIAEIKAKISGNPKIAAWLKVGHDELKEWFAEKQKDPKFDPFADEEDGEEGVEG